MSDGVESMDGTAVIIAIIFMSADIECLREHPITPAAERHILVNTPNIPKPDLKVQE